MIIIKRKIYAELESVGKKSKKIHPKKVIDRILMHTLIKVKNSIFLSLFSHAFLKTFVKVVKIVVPLLYSVQ
jgi:hypothetical protein